MSMTPKKELSLFDSTCIIVGIIIGVGIYETAPTVAAGMAGATGTIAIWLLGGLIALAGAFCYAELATAYPQQGGDYVYLNRAYGKWAGFLFGWSQMGIIRPGDIALFAFIFARYAHKLYPAANTLIYAASAIIVLTTINVLGVKQGKWTQNVLTMVKTLGLVAIIILGFLSPNTSQTAPSQPITMPGFQLALILVLFTFGGWHEMAYIATEVKRPHQNILRAMLIGIIAVTVLYVLINCAFLFTLGHTRMAASQAVAVETVAAILPGIAAKAVSILICISALSVINGLIFTGARVSYAMGTGHNLFRHLGKWNNRLGTPAWALALQGSLSLMIVLAAGSFIDTILYTAPVFWMFFLATAISVFVLRKKDPKIPRPYKITAYPAPAIIFSISCAFMLYSCASYAWKNKPVGLAIVSAVVLAGAIVYWITDARVGKKPLRIHLRPGLKKRIVYMVLAPIILTVVFTGMFVNTAKADSLDNKYYIRTADLVTLSKRFVQPHDDLPSPALLSVDKIIAFEENQHFVYIRGTGPFGDRHVIFCQPNTFVIYDLPAAPTRPWRLICSNTPQKTEYGFSVSQGDKVLTGQSILPNSNVKISRVGQAQIIETLPNNNADTPRFLNVFHIGTKDADVPKTTFTEKNGIARLNLITNDRSFSLVLPTEPAEPGTIAVSQAGNVLLEQRPFPVGIMPHGSEGVRMLRKWDSAYWGDRIPGWELARPSKELEMAVANRTIRPGRTLVLGCGSGINAVYLAQKGFDVTAVDVAPTALVIGKQRADKANVKVKWLLTDVLAMPDLGTFDFIFDRGCYHWVRKYDVEGFIEMTRQVSHDNTHFMVIAGNANESRHYGPPRVEEIQIVSEFSNVWDFVWLKEIRLGAIKLNPEGGTPLAWSILLRRKP